jgi:Ca-activated chloride channel family protein
MSAIYFQKIEIFYLLWIIPVLLLFQIIAWHNAKKRLYKFVQMPLAAKLADSVHEGKRIMKVILFLVSLIFIIIALARPCWGLKSHVVKRLGRDVVFILDVSRSMLAEDIAPNRLERAKLAIKDCIEQMEGDRVGLVAFAGSAVVKCPLTLDYGFFRMLLDDITPDTIERGGSMIGDAIRKAVDECFDNLARKHKDIILITDGEDHDSFPVEAAKEAGARGIRIIAVGLGSEDEGARIPVIEDGKKFFLKYQNKEVWTKLNAQLLRQIASATPNGVYLNVGTGNIDLGQVYKQLIATSEKKELSSELYRRYEEKFQIFLGIAIVLLCIETILGETRTKNVLPVR